LSKQPNVGLRKKCKIIEHRDNHKKIEPFWLNKVINRTEKGKHADKGQEHPRIIERKRYPHENTYLGNKRMVRNTKLTKLNTKVTTLVIERNTKITTTVIERNRGTASSEPWRGMDMNENDKWNGEKPRGTQRLQPQSWKRTESCGEEPKAVNHGEERK